MTWRPGQAAATAASASAFILQRRDRRWSGRPHRAQWAELDASKVQVAAPGASTSFLRPAARAAVSAESGGERRVPGASASASILRRGGAGESRVGVAAVPPSSLRKLPARLAAWRQPLACQRGTGSLARTCRTRRRATVPRSRRAARRGGSPAVSPSPALVCKAAPQPSRQALLLCAGPPLAPAVRVDGPQLRSLPIHGGAAVVPVVGRQVDQHRAAAFAGVGWAGGKMAGGVEGGC